MTTTTKKRLTSYQKIERALLERGNAWLRVSDFCNLTGELFIGYKANSRLAEMVNRGDIETRKDPIKPKFTNYRLNPDKYDV